MFAPLFLLFTVVPALELYLLFQVGGLIGGFNTIMLIILTGIVGASLAKFQGISILSRIQVEMQKGELPADQFIHGLMVFAGGLLLLTPGIMTDIIGFLLVIPGSRHMLMVLVKQAISKSMASGNFQFATFSNSGQGFSYTSYSSQSTPFEEVRPEYKSQSRVEGDVFEAEYTQKK